MLHARVKVLIIKLYKSIALPYLPAVEGFENTVSVGNELLKSGQRI